MSINYFDLIKKNATLHVFSFLPLEDIRNVRLVNKRFHQLAIQLFEAYFKNSPAVFQNGDAIKEIETITFPRITQLKTCESFYFLVYNDNKCLQVRKRDKIIKTNEFEDKIIAIDCIKNKFLINFKSKTIICEINENDIKVTQEVECLFDKINNHSFFINNNEVAIGINHVFKIFDLSKKETTKTVWMQKWDGTPIAQLHLLLTVRYDDNTFYLNSLYNSHSFSSLFCPSLHFIKKTDGSAETESLVIHHYGQIPKYNLTSINHLDYQVVDGLVFFLQPIPMENNFYDFSNKGLHVICSKGEPVKILEHIEHFTIDKSKKTLNVIESSGLAKIYQLPLTSKKFDAKLVYHFSLKEIGKQFLCAPELAFSRFRKLPENIKKKTYELFYSEVIRSKGSYFDQLRQAEKTDIEGDVLWESLTIGNGYRCEALLRMAQWILYQPSSKTVSHN